MDVNFYRTSTAGRGYLGYHAAPSAPEPSKRQAVENSGSYDQLTLRGRAPYPSDTTQFARILAREAAKEIQAPPDSARVEKLRVQVASGTYVPDADTIARHMLCYS